MPTPSGLVGWWQGEANTADFVNANNGVVHGNVTFAPGMVHDAFVLDGSGAGVVLSNTAALQLQSLSVEAWIKRASLSSASQTIGGGIIFGYGSSGYAVGMQDNGLIYLTAVASSSTAATGGAIRSRRRATTMRPDGAIRPGTISRTGGCTVSTPKGSSPNSAATR